MKAPRDKKIAFTFMSEPSGRQELKWTARLEFPPGAEADDDLPITVVGGDDEPIGSAVLELAGMSIAVKDGRASVKYADFIKGKHSTSLWLHREGMPPVAGGLTFA